MVRNFLKDKANQKLFIDAICNPTEENRRKLDLQFKKYYFSARFIVLVSTTLYFNAINYDKRFQRNKKRFPPTINRPLNDMEEDSLIDFIEDTDSQINLDDIIRSSSIEDYIEDSLLHEAVRQLSSKQKEVIDLYYVKGFTNTEIGKRLNKSQQAISKLHKTALKKIHEFIQQNGCE